MTIPRRVALAGFEWCPVSTLGPVTTRNDERWEEACVSDESRPYFSSVREKLYALGRHTAKRMDFAPKITVLAVILAVVSAILANRVFHNRPLSVLVLLVVGFFLPLVLGERYKRMRN
ncbi:hypothetical protein [Haladaptatus sp. CMAA 1911]|uniref:hypothetical protein n=2 Tax=Haladaptatus TaxID=367188 RepID=UPI00375508F4